MIFDPDSDFVASLIINDPIILYLCWKSLSYRNYLLIITRDMDFMWLLGLKFDEDGNIKSKTARGYGQSISV